MITKITTNQNELLADWQKEIANFSTKTFCILPWIHFTTRTNGDMRLCCVSNASGIDQDIFDAGLVKNDTGKYANFQLDTLRNEWNNDYMKSVRKIMLDGKIPSSCVKCFNEEKLGMTSKRVWETLHWKNEIDIPALITNTDDGKIPTRVLYIDLRLGHDCNLKCVMCGPTDSSRWVTDHKKMQPLINHNKIISQQMAWDENSFNNKWYENTLFWDELHQQIPYIKQLNFAGGEPLLIKNHKLFIKSIIDSGYSGNIMLKYNTNGLFIDEEMIELWIQFKKVQIGVSLDAVGDRNYYIRFPSNWDIIVQNLIKLDNTPDNIEVTIACALQILNIKHIADFIKWKITQKFKKINNAIRERGIMVGGGILNVHFVYMPTYLDMRILPQKDKDEITGIFAELKHWLWHNYTQDTAFWETNPYGWQRWEAVLNFLHSDDKSENLINFKEYITSLDKIRNLNSLEYFPELSHLIGEP